MKQVPRDILRSAAVNNMRNIYSVREKAGSYAIKKRKIIKNIQRNINTLLSTDTAITIEWKQKYSIMETETSSNNRFPLLLRVFGTSAEGLMTRIS